MRFGGLIIAIVLAAIAAIVVLRMTNTPPPAPAATTVANVEPVKANIYVAAVPIPVGATITAEMLAVQPWPETLILPGFIRADGGKQSIANQAVGSNNEAPGVNNIIGNIARSPFQQQEPIISTKLANPKDPNFLAADLPKGMRIVTILTNETEGLAGFIFPGDHVDVILTHDIKPKSGAVGEDVPVTETLLNNVTVIAVDQRASGAGATDKDGKLIVPRSVSLMVSQVDAQRLRLGQKIGTLTLSLRSIADRDSVDPATIIRSEDVSQYKGGPANTSGGAPVNGITVYRGTTKSDDATPAAPAAALSPLPAGVAPRATADTITPSAAAGHQ